ncbi:hypothetical protein Tco_1148695, partial [Tanacetum coccineum]
EVGEIQRQVSRGEAIIEQQYNMPTGREEEPQANEQKESVPYGGNGGWAGSEIGDARFGIFDERGGGEDGKE